MKPARLSLLVLGALCVLAILGTPQARAARDFTGSASNYLKTTTFTTSDAPFTLAGWIRCDTTTTVMVPFAMTDGNGGVSEDGWTLSVLASNVVRMQCIAGGSGTNAATTNTITDGTWSHVFYVETTSASRTCVLNGDLANAGVNTTGRNPANPIEITFGGQGTSGGAAITNPLDGQMQNWALWDVALTSETATALYGGGRGGVDPRSLGRGHMIGYWLMLQGAGEPNVASGAGALTLTGTLSTISGIPIRGGTR